MTELLADPGFDLIYGRTGSVFIPRDNGPEARSMLRHLGEGADPLMAVVIFPEGRLFRPERLERSLARLADNNPDRAARLATLRHVLPPRPGGVLALLESIPDTDVVVIAHAGLDHFASFGSWPGLFRYATRSGSPHGVSRGRHPDREHRSHCVAR